MSSFKGFRVLHLGVFVVTNFLLWLVLFLALSFVFRMVGVKSTRAEVGGQLRLGEQILFRQNLPQYIFSVAILLALFVHAPIDYIDGPQISLWSAGTLVFVILVSTLLVVRSSKERHPDDSP